MREQGAASRRIALECLVHVLSRRNTLAKAFVQTLTPHTLEARDRAFVLVLVNTVLRQLGVFDSILEQLLSHPLSGHHSTRVQNVLRLGAAQVLVLEIKDYAAVSSSVLLAEGIAGGRYCSLVNAVLRNLVRRKQELWPAYAERLRLSTPEWLWGSWQSSYGLKVCEQIAAQHILSPPLALTVKREPARWASRLGAQPLFGNSIVFEDSLRVYDLEGYDEGAWWVQDPAAALPICLLGDVADREVLDLCAAPGGKTSQLVEAGARVVAVDYSPERFQVLKENLQRVGFEKKVQCVLSDVVNFHPPKLFDIILLDAPCSGTGTIRRHPDILRLKTLEEVKRLHALQCRLLEAAWRLLAPKGRLVYSCCSLETLEGEGTLDRFMQGKQASLLPISPSSLYGYEQFLTEQGCMRTLPFFLAEQGGLDGFFAALIQKIP